MRRRRHGRGGPVRDLLIPDTIAKHWKALAVLLGIASAFDYWDHVSRPGQAFAEAPIAWFGFTLASTATLLLAAFSTARLLGRTRVPQLVADTVGVAFAIAFHLLVAGPLWDRLFWTGKLYFDALALPVVAGTALYLLFRGAFAAVSRLFGTKAG